MSVPRRDDGASPRRGLATDGRNVRAADRGRRGERRSGPALSVLPGVSARRACSIARRAARVASRMEVGRHPRPGIPPRRDDGPLVARRRARHRSLSRTADAVWMRCRRHGARRRDPGLARRAAAAVRRAAKADRSQSGSRRRFSSDAPTAFMAYDLLGDRRRRPARATARRAPRAARSRSSPRSTQPRLRLSPLVPFDTWDELEAAVSPGPRSSRSKA